MLLHPLMLAWIGGAALPLILHLLSRSQYRVVSWGATMFLTGAAGQSQNSARARQIILLLCRMCALGLLAVALARPVVASHYSLVPTAGLTTGVPAAVVIIVDDSVSMGYTKNGISRLDQARQVTLQILSSLKRGDQAALFLAGARDPQPNVLSTDLQSIDSRIADSEPDIGQADFAFELNRAADLLSHTTSDDQQIYLITDTQALSWKNVTATFKKKMIARHPNRSFARVTVIPVGGNESDNVAVDAIDVPDHLAVRDQPEMATVRVHNYGSTSQTAVPLTVWTGARTIVQTTITVPAGSTKTVAFPLRFGEAGSRVLSAAVTSTGLTSDDRLDSAVDVIDSLQIMRVNNTTEISTSRPATQAATSGHETVRKMGKAADRNLRPGEPVVARVYDLVDERSATVQFASGGPREPAVVSPSADHTQISYTKTIRPGTYRLRYRSAGKETSLNYVVAAPRSDSDLTPLSQDQWKTLADRIGFQLLDLSKTTVAQAMNVQRGGREIWIDLLGCVLFLMTAEMLLSRRWST